LGPCPGFCESSHNLAHKRIQISALALLPIYSSISQCPGPQVLAYFE
jgi:hypothetical protein